MRVGEPGVFALGDCAIDKCNPMVPLAKVAEQQGKYLASCINDVYARDADALPAKEFEYVDVGSMVSIGNFQGMLDMTHINRNAKMGNNRLSGFLAFLSWRTAYWGKTVSWSNKLLIPMYWFKSFVFGRDISRF